MPPKRARMRAGEASDQSRVNTVVIFHRATVKMTLNERLETILLNSTHRSGRCDGHKIDAMLTTIYLHVGEGYVAGCIKAVVFNQQLEIAGIDFILVCRTCRRSQELDFVGRGDKSHLDGGTMEYHHRVDPALIGGFTVTIDNDKLDASVADELKQLRLKLLSN